MPLVIDELLAGLALNKAFDGLVAARRFVQARPRERLLLLMHRDFGSAADLDRAAFYSWANHPGLVGAIDDLIAGRRQPDAETHAVLAQEIEARLVRTDASGRGDLAAQMAFALLRAYPLALREFAEFGQLLTNKLDAHADQSQEEHSEMLSILRRLDTDADDTEELSRMLLAGSLAPVGQDENARRAEELVQQEQFVDAARVLEEIAAAFDEAGTPSLSESYLIRAAAMYERGDNPEVAARLLERVAWARIERRARESLTTARELERLLGNTALLRGIKACADWPELAYAPDWLRQAIDEETDPGRRMRFHAALAEVESITGESETVLADAEDVEGDLGPGPRLAIELDRIHALESRSAQAADDAWQEVQEWADTVADPTSQGRCWARRGMQLAYRGDLNGARSAYRRAMTAWAKVPGSQEQVAEAFFSMQAAEVHLGAWQQMDLDLRAVAASLRGGPGTPAAVARRLQNAAAGQRIQGSFQTPIGTIGWLSPSTVRTAAFRASWRSPLSSLSCSFRLDEPPRLSASTSQRGRAKRPPAWSASYRPRVSRPPWPLQARPGSELPRTEFSTLWGLTLQSSLCTFLPTSLSLTRISRETNTWRSWRCRRRRHWRAWRCKCLRRCERSRSSASVRD